MRKLSESVWNNIRRQSAGKQDRQEDDINLLSPYEFCMYIRDAYEGKNGFSIDSSVHMDRLTKVIIIDLYEDSHEMNGGIRMKIEHCEQDWPEVEGNKTYGVLEPNTMRGNLYDVPILLVKELEEFAVMRQRGAENQYNSYYLIYPKDGVKTTNKFLIKVIDCILKRIEENWDYKIRLKRKKNEEVE